MPGISHDREQETPEAKARWFQSLTVEERMDYLCFITDLLLENRPNALKTKSVQPTARRVLILTAA